MAQAVHKHDTSESDFGRYLVAQGLLSPSALLQLRGDTSVNQGDLQDALVRSGLVYPSTASQAMASFLQLPFIDLARAAPDPELASAADPALMLRYRVLPWRTAGARITFAVADPAQFRAFLRSYHGEADFVLAAPAQITEWISQTHRLLLTERASARVPSNESCRTWERRTSKTRLALTLLCLSAFIAAVALYPQAIFAAFAAWACATLVISAIMRLCAFLAEVSAAEEPLPPPCPPEALPDISVLVPLFKEREIAGHLLKRLARLSYPKSKLQVVLAVEENDETTRDTLSAATLPPWMDIVVVPEGAPKTKPRALNYALDFCKGEIIGIWDAEDAPAPDQLETVARVFHHSSEDTVCLQGVLDYYNARQNWLARCFTIEYAAWFRLILPGMSRLGFAIPLGGTTLFFKRDALEELGGWDAHNVTEDADLGFRLARHGYRTEVIPTRTGEEANCRLWPWVRQRSRWLKGYMVTYLVHMRAPLTLWRQLGTWRFLGFQAHFVTALSQFVLAPVLWSFWLVLFGLPHPLEAYVPREVLAALGISFLVIELINALINASAASKPGLRHLLAWVPTMHFYYPLGAIAAYKALYELIVKPFYWDKTEHGLSVAHMAKAPTAASAPRGIQLEAGHKSP